jgi:metal-dependent amidase/aminoacylase/carboxypeptidase family protein
MLICEKQTPLFLASQALKLAFSYLTLSNQFFVEIVSNRRYSHQYPELSFEEHNMSRYLCQKLDEEGVVYRSGIAKTGVVVLIKGKNPDSKKRLFPVE